MVCGRTESTTLFVRRNPLPAFFCFSAKDKVMLDVLYLVLVLAFFVVGAAYTRACDRL